MKPYLTRRDFLKVAGMYSASAALPAYFLKSDRPVSNKNKPNFLIIVFDAWSASNMSLYGYGRTTTPHLDRLAEKAIVYHNHYAGGNFTTPGTASLLTGTLPWSHRAYILNDTVHKSYAKRSVFHAFEDYQRIAYTHNPIANTLLRQFMTGLDDYIPMRDFFLESNTLVDTLFSDDHDIATVSWNRALKQRDDGFSYSLFFSQIYDFFKKDKLEKLENSASEFPRGLPNYDGIAYFTLEDGVDGVVHVLDNNPQPFLGYFHFLPPHNPFKTRMDFNNTFSNDGYMPPDKPNHLFIGDSNKTNILKKRRLYDEFILYVDSEFARLYKRLEAAGVLDNTYLILTSDHGEMFERGILGHMTPSLHQPVINIPLVIFPPGQNTRVDVRSTTSAIDLLPTLKQIADREIPAWSEGSVLAPFSPESNDEIFALQVEAVDKEKRISNATVMMVAGQYKLNWYFGYDELSENGELVELYDLNADPEELVNLFQSKSEIAEMMLRSTKLKLEEKVNHS